MKRLLIALMLLGLFMATNTNVNSCGSYSVSTGSSITLTADIYANSGSNITDGACIFMNGPQSITAYMAGYKIINNGSNATIGIHINNTYTSSSVAGTSRIYNTSEIIGFQTGILHTSNNTHGVIGFSTYSQINVTNATYAIRTNDYTLDTPAFSGICTKNTTYALWMNYTGTSAIPTFSLPCTVGTTFTSAVLDRGPEFMGSNKLFAHNGNYNLTYNATVGGQAYQGQVTHFFQTLDTATAAYFTSPVVIFVDGVNTNLVTTTAATAATGSFKHYFCLSGYCNPLIYLNDVLPLNVSAPDTVAPVKFTQAYSNLTIWWIVGSAKYIVAASTNNTDEYFYLQPNGLYEVHFDNTTINVTNTCPSIYSVCYLTITTSPLLNYSFLVIPNTGCTGDNATNSIYCYLIDVTNTTNHTTYIIKNGASTVCNSTQNGSSTAYNCTGLNLTGYVYSYYVYRDSTIVTSGMVDKRPVASIFQLWWVAVVGVVIGMFFGMMVSPGLAVAGGGIAMFAMSVSQILPISLTTASITLGISLIIAWMLSR